MLDSWKHYLGFWPPSKCARGDCPIENRCEIYREYWFLREEERINRKAEYDREWNAHVEESFKRFQANASKSKRKQHTRNFTKRKRNAR